MVTSPWHKLMKKIKTVQDVARVPENVFIDMMVYGEAKCPFCGSILSYEIVGFGRDKCRQYHSCSCKVAQAAEAHNQRKKELDNLAWQQKCQEAEEKRRKEEEKRRKEEAKKPVVITAGEMICAYTGRVLPQMDFLDTHDKVCRGMRKIGIEEGDTKNMLSIYARNNGFLEGLKKASDVISSYVCSPEVNWYTNIDNEIKEVCDRYGVPMSITL